MEKIRFLGSKNVYDGEVYVNGPVVSIRFIGVFPPNGSLTKGFELLNENNGFVQGDYTQFTTIYRTYDEDHMLIELSDDGSIYVPPAIPEPEPDPEPYVPTEEELAAMLGQAKIDKVNLSKSLLGSYLGQHPLASTAHNGTEGVYSVTDEKQTLMMRQYLAYQIEKAVNPNAKLTWNETGKPCEEWTEQELIRLILETKEYVYPLVSYQQSLEERITACTSQGELDAIRIDYGSVHNKETEAHSG